MCVKKLYNEGLLKVSKEVQMDKWTNGGMVLVLVAHDHS